MGIMLTNIRVQNFRSIENLDLELGITNLLIGQNNTGKSNFLRAVNVALGATSDVSDSDIFIADGERLAKTKCAIIDIMLRPTDDDWKTTRTFSDFWTDVFTVGWITTNPEGAFVGIRTEIKLDIAKDNYVINRKCIRQWNDSIETAQLDGKRPTFNEDMRQYISSFYMDANRDIVQDLRNKRSFFGRVTSGYNMADAKIAEIEAQLNDVNEAIIESIPSLQQTKDKIAAIGRTIGSSTSSVEIEPLTRKISDLSRGMDIVMQDGGAILPISQNGSGTRSWISFLTLSAFVENQARNIKNDDSEAEQYAMLAMEEPEAHLHPQGQRQLFNQMQNFMGQKIISTHSPSIVSQSALADAIYFYKSDGKTVAIRYKSTTNSGNENDQTNEEEQILRKVINTRAEMLFASAIILCEGITEELALPVYFHEYFGCIPFSLGVSIINVGGQDYEPYLLLARDFNIPWFIFSDGESDAIKSVNSVVESRFGLDYATMRNIVIIGNGNAYETYLIKEGYSDTIIEAVSAYENDENYIDTYMRLMQGQGRKPKIARLLNQDKIRDYTIPSGRSDALIEICLGDKADYALPVARKIISLADTNKRLPSKISELYDEVATKLGVQKAPPSEA